MKVFTCETWSQLDRFSTEAGRFVGLAIGPESDEAIVRIGELVLQAGRPLPLASSGSPYTVERVVTPKNTITAIARLQLLAFECAEELAADLARASGRYSASSALTAAGGWQRLITVPFVGRRQARFQLVCAAATVSYRILGLTYNAGARALKESLLESVADEAPDDDSTLAFYMGGTNEAEAWDALALEVTPASDQTCSVDVVTIGELGAR